MYKLRDANKSLLEQDSGSTAKLQKGVNLRKSHWESIDAVAENTGKSRNATLRQILDEYFNLEVDE